MKFDCKDKVVLVTGASSGIGEAMAKAFAKEGAKVALFGRNNQRLKEVQDDIAQSGGTAAIFSCELAETDRLNEYVKEVEECFGDSISVLINNAGIGILGFVDDVPIEEYLRNLQVNFTAPLALIKAVVPKMKEKREGQIINFNSGVGIRGLPGVSPYCVSKFALNALTESIRVELSEFGIDVISISPGLVQTNFSSRIKKFGSLKEDFASGKAITANEVAERVVLASQRAERSVTISMRTKIAHHLNYWAPGLFDHLLRQKMANK